MRVIPENEKLIQLEGNDDEDEGWVDTHHGVSKSVYTIVSTLSIHIAYSIVYCAWYCIAIMHTSSYHFYFLCSSR